MSKPVDRLDGLRRIGIDEISYKRDHRYLIVVVDHDTGRRVWAGPGRNDAALHAFFDELGDDRAALLTHVSADMADWIARVVAARASNAVHCADPFHVVAWAIDALEHHIGLGHFDNDPQPVLRARGGTGERRRGRAPQRGGLHVDEQAALWGEAGVEGAAYGRVDAGMSRAVTASGPAAPAAANASAGPS